MTLSCKDRDLDRQVSMQLFLTRQLNWTMKQQDARKVDCKDGFRGGKEFSLRPRSLLRTIDETSENYPENIADFPVLHYLPEFAQTHVH